MKEYQYKVTDPSGLHARPATMIASYCARHGSSVYIGSGSQMVDGSDVLAIMSLYVMCGQDICFYIEGEDEEEAFLDLKEVLKEL